MRHVGGHHTLPVEYSAVRHAYDHRGRAHGGKMAVIDKIEALNVSRKLVV